MEFKRKEKKSTFNPFQKRGHNCTIKDELLDPISFAVPDNVRFSRFRQWCLRFRLVSEFDAMAQKLFRSQFSIDREKTRHLLYHRHMIHPASKFRAWWEAFMILILSISLIATPFYMAILQVEEEKRNIEVLVMGMVLEIFCFVNLVLTFFTGVQNRSDYEACLDFRLVAYKYIKGTFVFDVLALIPFVHLIELITGVNKVYSDFFLIVKVVRIFPLLRYFNNFAKRMEIKLTIVQLTKVLIMLITYVTWITFLQFFVVYLTEGSYNPAHPNRYSWLSFFNVWGKSREERFFVGLFRAAILITHQGLGMEYPLTTTDQLFAAFVWVSSLALYAYIMAGIISMVLGLKSSKAQYYMTIQQLNAYMDRKELSQHLKNKLRQFYQLRYHKSFFSETDILESVSGRLLQDVRMHSCRKVVEDVPFLKHLPDEMLVRIVSTLRSEIFLPNEVIVKVNSIGDCMYFIVTGTVAVYSAGGRELCHLQDGAYFGEVAVVGGPRRRTASVVALHACELLRLDAAEFAKAAAHHPELLEGIMRVAADRVEHTSEVDKTLN